MSSSYKYVRASGIRTLVKENGKRCGSDFLHALDTHIYDAVLKCCKQFNRHKQTLDGTVANFVLIKKEEWNMAVNTYYDEDGNVYGSFEGKDKIHYNIKLTREQADALATSLKQTLQDMEITLAEVKNA